MTELSPLTFGNEDALPRIPLPTVDRSCDLFLEWCAPLLTAEELAQTEKAVARFREEGSGARVLHAALAEYDAEPGVHSWLDGFWRRRYLGRRDRIALNANFFFLFQPAEGEPGQVERAATLTAAAVAFKGRIDAQEVPPEVQRGRPLSMEQLKYVFSACRIPGAEIDSSRTAYPSDARHVVVFHHGAVFALDVVAPSGAPHTTAEIADGLRAVLAASPERGQAVGHLTTKARAEWAASREALRALDPANAQACEAIETALFCVALEDTVPADARQACEHLLHGDSGNRWFDKSVTLVVFGDGSAGLNGEHCELDGTTVVAFIDAIIGTPAVDGEPQGAPAVAPVEFVLDDALRADVEEAGRAFADYAAATATSTLSVEGFTSGTAKALGVSPDAFCQLAFQLAHQRAKGHLGATYESIATRHFHHGRTEAMRVVTPQIAAFVAAMVDPAASDDRRRAAFRAAAEAHVARARQCQAGDAPEQHLWELQMLQQRRGAELGVPEPLELYDSPGWRIVRDDYLSTSAVPSPRVQYFGFGSTSPTCIGVGYGLQADRFDIHLSTPESVREQMTVFARCVRESVAELVELLA
ncbi:MAG: choline/carnitine O-acyltransferase [Pseudonocardiales bacterium]|nr:choline/carnitine O-acyltransferase [Pseudonocardiales bacterium]